MSFFQSPLDFKVGCQIILPFNTAFTPNVVADTNSNNLVAVPKQFIVSTLYVYSQTSVYELNSFLKVVRKPKCS